jgi:3-methyladenine DNA glycosylase AlkD
MADFVLLLAQALAPLGNAEVAAGQRAYMRDQFPFLGVPMLRRRATFKQLIKQTGMPPDVPAVAMSLWQRPEREFQYCAVDLLLANGKKNEQESNLAVYETLICQKSWWDTVDALAPVVGQYLAKYPEQREPLTQKWLQSGHLWLMRTAILFQLGYKKQTDEALLFRIVLQAAPNQDFFIRKGIGWALREYAKTNPQAVRNFVSQHTGELSPLSQREALKRLG